MEPREKMVEIVEVEVDENMGLAVKPKSRFDFLNDLHPFVVVGVVILLTMLATFFVPGGQYERESVEVIGMTRDVILPETFKYVDSVPQGPAQVWTYFIEGAVEASDIIFCIFICAGALNAIIHTGAVGAGIGALVGGFKEKTFLLIPVMVFAFSLGGAVYGMYEDAVPFIMVMAPMMLMMRYDSAVAVMVVQLGCVVGSASGFLNPFAVGVGQALAEIPMTSGIGVRVIVWFFMTLGTAAYVMNYAMKVRKDPSYSICLEEDVHNRIRFAENSVELDRFTGKHKLVLALMAAGFGIMIYGVMKQGWWFNEIGSIFLVMGVVIPFIGGMKINGIIEKFMEGMGTMLTAACLMAASRIIFFILTNSNIMDTLLFNISNSLNELPDVVTVWLMYGVSSVAMMVVNSSSGLAATLMPIMAPLADVLGISRQMAVTAYQLSTSTFGFWMPWDGITFAMCSLAGINFFKYLKRCAHYVFTFYIPASIVVLALLTILKF